MAIVVGFVRLTVGDDGSGTSVDVARACFDLLTSSVIVTAVRYDGYQEK